MSHKNVHNFHQAARCFFNEQNTGVIHWYVKMNWNGIKVITRKPSYLIILLYEKIAKETKL